jgi:serine protease Do
VALSNPSSIDDKEQNMPMKKMLNHWGTRLTLAVWGGAVLVAVSTAASAYAQPAKSEGDRAALKVPLDETPVPRDGLPRGSYAGIIQKVAPGVVKIVTTNRGKKDSVRAFPGFNDPFWRHFFGDRFGQAFRGQPSGPPLEHGLGSGVIVTPDGYILTNNHVVDGAGEVEVTLADGREFTAKVIGRDPKSDIAVVKIDAQDLPTVPMADSSQVQVGDVVLAIGNPFGVGQTVTEGIVSAKNRGNMGIEAYEDFIQTDAAINPGNSGGALVDINGRLIGINTAILSRSGGSQGVGFAVPTALARNVMESLVQYGHVTRGYLGVMIQDVTPALAQQFKVKEARGALIGEVVPQGPAEKAGFKAGDVVTAFNGKAIAESRQLQLEVAQTKPGTTVPVEILRHGDRRTLSVAVKPLPANDQVAEASGGGAEDTGTLNGVAVTDLDPQTRDQFHLPRNVHGAVVTQVEPDSAAAEAGLRPGAVIQEINHHPVKSANDAVQLTENTGDKKTLLRIWENGGSRYVVVDESKQSG